MTDKLRAAAQAAYRAMVAMELSDGSKREWDAAVSGLRVALAINPSSVPPHLGHEPHDSSSPCQTSQKSATIDKTPPCPG